LRIGRKGRERQKLLITMTLERKCKSDLCIAEKEARCINLPLSHLRSEARGHLNREGISFTFRLHAFDSPPPLPSLLSSFLSSYLHPAFLAVAWSPGDRRRRCYYSSGLPCRVSLGRFGQKRARRSAIGARSWRTCS